MVGEDVVEEVAIFVGFGEGIDGGGAVPEVLVDFGEGMEEEFSFEGGIIDPFWVYLLSEGGG